MPEDLPRLYSQLASWWHLLSAPEDYADEARFFARVFRDLCVPAPRTLLELGSGGGNNASHLKQHFQMTLVDLSPDMLAQSHTLNPECEHVAGDMRTVRLGRVFDGVFVHDAIGYMTSEPDLRAAMESAFVHCRPGGVAIFAPDYARETFVPTTDHGGHDGHGRGVRYLEWTRDDDPSDTVYTAEFAYLLRERDGSVRVEHDRHVMGMFSRDVWTRLLSEVGFEPRVLRDRWGRDVFVGVRR